jgi:hypothetical protein
VSVCSVRRDNVVGIASLYRLDSSGFELRCGNIFPPFQTGRGAFLWYNWNRRSFPGKPGRAFEHAALWSAEVKTSRAIPALRGLL